ncbi:hypothetical protein Tco_1262720 [Tanacetum coccineum]
MAPLTFADTHNMVAYLSKSDASEGFDQILDFLNASTIRYALTVNPTIYVSCIKQFWSTAKVKTVNGVVQLQALIDGKKVFVSEAIKRRDLYLEDAERVECMPNNEIFEELARMGYEKPPPKLTFYKAFFVPQWKFLIHNTLINGLQRSETFLQVFLDNQVDDMTSHHTKYTSPALTQKVFANMRRVDEDVKMPVDEEQPATTSAPSTSEPQDQPSTPHDSPEQEPTHSSPHDSPLTGVNPPRSEEGSLWQTSCLNDGVGYKFAEEGGMISNIDTDVEISLVDETQRLDDDLIFNTTTDLGGEEVVVKPAKTGVSDALDVEVSAADHVVTIVSLLVTIDSVTIIAAEPVSDAAKELTDNDMTMAEALAKLKTSKPKVVTTVPILNSTIIVITTKPKAKGITIQEPLVTQKTLVSFISSSKGKAIMIESEKPVKIKDLSAHDEQVAKDLHDKIQIDADQELAARMTLEEHENYVRLVMQRFKTTTPEEIDLILWGDLKTMFEANAVDELWKNQEDWILKSWNLYENCGVHILMLEDGTEFHMLAERKYPLTKETLEKMLVLILTAKSKSEATCDLLRNLMIDKSYYCQLKIYVLLVEDFVAAKFLKNLLQVVSAVRVNINIVFVEV